MKTMLKNRRRLALAAVALATLLVACGQNPTEEATAAAADVSAAWSNAFDSGNAAALAALYADDARTLPPDGGTLAGRGQIESVLAR